MGVSELELREEYEDGVEYNKFNNKSADGQRLIEEKRLLLLGSTAHGCATAAHLFNPRSASHYYLASHPLAPKIGPFGSSPSFLHAVSRTTLCIDSGVVGNRRRVTNIQMGPDGGRHRVPLHHSGSWSPIPCNNRLPEP